MRKMNFLLNWSKKDQVKRTKWGTSKVQVGYKLSKKGTGLAGESMEGRSWGEGSLTSGRAPIEHPLSIHSASIQHPLQLGGNKVKTSLRFLRYVAMIFAVLVMSVANIGMAWGATHTVTPNIGVTQYEIYNIYSNSSAYAFFSNATTIRSAYSSWVSGQLSSKSDAGATAPSGWLSTGSGKPGYGKGYVNNSKTVTMTVTNCIEVAFVSKSGGGSRTSNLSVKLNGVEVGSVATNGNSYAAVTYGTALDASKTYTITLSGSTSDNCEVDQIRFKAPAVCSATLGGTTSNPSATVGESAGTISCTVNNGAAKTATSYQWYKNTSKSTSGATSISGATSSTYSPNEASAGTYYYYCTVQTAQITTDGADAARITSGISDAFVFTAAPAGSGWGIASSANSYTPASDEMSGSGTVTKTLSLSAGTDLQFKIVDISGNVWYGNGEIWGGTKTQSVSSTGTANNCHLLTTEAGSYTFSFNTSTKDLTITYPNSYTFYYANTGSWSNVYVYKFTSNGSTGKNAAWPGVEIASKAYTCGGTDYYEATSDGYAKLIFTNNSGNQTGDMVVSSSNAGKYVAGTDNSWSNFPTYTVTYNKNGDGAGGAGSVTGSVPTDSNSPYACGSTVTVLGNTGSLALDGYTFAGWNTAPGGGGTSYAADATFTISANTTLYAQWEEDASYSVTYNANGATGSVPTDANTYANGEEVTVLGKNTLAKTNYGFAGWRTAVSSGTWYVQGQTFEMGSANVNLYAQWVAEASMVSGTLYKAVDMKASATSATGQYRAGISANGIFEVLGVGVVDATTGPMEYGSDSRTIDGTAFTEALHFKGTGSGSPSGSTLPTTRAIKFRVPAAGTLHLWVRAGSKIAIVKSGGSASAVGSSTDRTHETVAVTAGTYYLYATGTSVSLYGLQFVQSCTAPTGLTAASTTAKGATLTVTDANDVNNYEFYVSTSSTAPEAGATATHSVSSAKSLTITNLVAGTTYYAWARSVCGVSNKSGWTALTGNTFITSTVSADYHLTNVTKSSGATSGIGGSTFTAVFAAVSGYSLPSPVVTIGGNSATSGTDYTWNAGTGTLTINANKINGDIDITLSSPAAAPSSVAISGDWLYFAGETIELTATPTGGNGPVTYQWYKGGKTDGDEIDGATSATYSKASCAYEDAGSYYCKVTCGGSASTWGQSGDAYDVKIPRLYVKTGHNYDPVKTDYGNVDFTRATASTATASITLGSNWDYCFNIADGCGHYYGNAGTMQYNNYGPWTTNVNNQDCGLRTTNGATYVFTINYSNWTQLTTTVTFPSSDQAADKIIYFDNQTVDWSTLHYRIGRADNTQATAMTKVPGTNNLYTVTTAAYSNAAGWHIANNAGWTGSNSIYRTYTNGDEYSITYATAHEGGAVTDAAVTVTPTTSRGTGADAGINDNCTFYNYEITTGMKTQNVAISDYSNGTITVNYVNTSNEAATLTSGNADLAHSVILTSITAVPNTGYDASAITINGGAYSANYVVTGSTTIAASFTPHVYNITYKDQGGSAFSGVHADGYPTTHTYGSTTALKGATKAGYTFGGWFGNSACTGVALSSIGGTDYSVDITLYAKWTAKSCTVTFDTEGGTGTITDVTATYDSAMPSKASNLPTKEGFDFDGFWDGDNGTGTKYYNADGSSARNWDKNTTETTTLYAKWTGHVYTITLNLQGGTGTTSVTATYNATLTSDALFDTPTKSNYTFGGFYTSEAGGGLQLINDSRKWNSSKSGYIDGDKKWIYSGADNVTLYAKWTQTITLDKNEGSADGSATAIWNGTGPFTPSAPTYDGHTVYKYISPTGLRDVLNPDGSFAGTNVNDGSGYDYIVDGKWVATAATTLKAYWKCDAPTISCTNNVVTMSVPSGATVYYTYTTDGSDPADPTSSSTEYDPSSKPTITEDTKFKAIAIQDGCVNSDIASATCTYEALCPTGGDIFTLKMDYSGSQVKVDKNSTLAWSDTYGSKSGGDVTFGNLSTSSTDPMQITNSNGGTAKFGGNDGYIKIDLDCPLKTGDVISFTSDETNQISFTKTDTRATSPATSSKKWTVTSTYNNVSTIYIWRASGSTVNLHTINITRPVTVTFDKNGGSSVSPTSATYDGSSAVTLATPVRTDYHCTGWNTAVGGDGTDLGLPGETYRPNVTTNTQTIYAQWTAKSCASGTIYQFTVSTSATNGNFPKQELVYVKTSDPLTTMTGGYLKAYNNGDDKLKVTSGKYITITDNGAYLLVQLDCALQAGDQIKSTVKSNTAYVTLSNVSRTSTVTLPVADNNTQTIPAALVGATELKIWKGGGNCNIVDFQIIRTASTYNVTYNGNGNTGGDVPTDATNYDYNDEVTVKSNSGSLAKTNYDALAYWNTKDDGTGTDYAIGSGTFNIQADTTLYAKWTQAVTLDENEGTTAGSATAVWNAKGLTSFTAVVPASGMKCTGYYTTASGEGTKVLNSDGTYASSSVADYVTSGKWSRTGAAPTLYARYESGGSLTWNLSVNTDATSLTTSSKSSAFTEIAVANMTDAALEDLTYDKSKKSNLTGTISTPASIDDGDYTYVTFVVASGYKFIPSKITVKAQPVSTAKYVKLVLSDGEREISYTSSSLAAGSIATVVKENADASKYMEGTVTLKIYCYGATDKYRLGTPITIDGSIEASCATMPSYSSMSYEQTEYAVDEEASAISIVGGTNISTYAWKQNTVNDRSGGTAASGTNNTASYTPPTSSEGTMYYWCEMTNSTCGITIQSAAVGITVSAEKTDATVTWTNPASTPNYGGGGYTIKATVNETGWNGNASDLTITAPTGITIYNVTSGTTDSKKWVQVSFDVTTSFNRETYESSIPFTVSAAATATYNAISDDNSVTYTSCSGGGEGTADIPVLSATHDEGSGNSPRYWWETTGNGRLFALNYGKSDCASTSDATLSSDGFNYVASSTNQRVLFQPYVAGVTKIRVYVKAATNGLKISSIGSKSSWQDQSSKYSDLAIDTIIYSNGKTTGLDNNDKGYMEVEFSSALTANNYYLITFSSSSVYMYGVKLYSSSAGSGGSLTTTLSWSPTLSDGATVDKTQSSANFTYTASPTGANNNTLGSITYTSSNTSCATVNALTGEVTITASGSSDLSTTITATLSASGCYKGKTITYIISVPGVSCTIEHGTLTSDVTSKCSTADATLTLTGFESGATVQWYKGESTISDGSTYHITTVGTTSTMVTKEAGTYSVMVTNATCSDRSNSVTISNISASASVTKIVDSWYVKNGRLTPDIALWSLSEGATLKSVAWSPSNATGLACVERDGIIYLEGKEPNTNSSSDVAYTLTATITDACGGDHVESTKTITITHQKNTDKHVLAFVVTGTEKGDFTAGVPASQTTSVDLYNAIAANFDVQATNIYSTDDEKALKEYYSQFDILCITDYPNTGTKGVNKKSYVDAIGSLIDIRPILTMEAYVAKLDNWAAKGVKGTPNSPCPRQYSMDLQCKDHEIFSGTNLVKVGEGDETMYRVTMVDKSKADYSTKDAETECSKAYDAGGYPALQGFTIGDIDEEMLPLGLIYDGETPLQVGIERQHEMSARLMVLGIQQKAMERLTTDGQTVVINALKYLMKKNEEEIADCSIAFIGGDDTKPNDWNTDANWKGGVKPDKTTREIRILAPVIITTGQKIHAMAPIKIASRGTYNDGTDEANGKITINAGGALKVDGKIQAVTAPSYSKARATSAGDIHIKASSTAQGALIFDNEDGETNATVEMYSSSYWVVEAGKKKKYWSYVALPIQSGTVGEYFYDGFSYLYDETSGWIKKGMYTELHAFEGLGISMQTGNMEYFHGALAPTTTQEITLTKTPAAGNGENLIGNSWTAPIQIANFDVSDFGGATATVMIYSTGRDDVKDNPTYVTATVENDGAVSAGQWLAIPIGLPGTTGYDGLSVIPAMQAFQVNTASETTLTLDYDKLVRDVNLATDNLTEKQHSPVRRAVKKDLASVMRVRVSGTRTRADVWLLEDNRFSDEFDNGWEAAYIDCDERSPQLYAQSPIGKMAFLAQPDMEGTVLGIAPSRDGNEYLFTFHYVGSEEYYLNDIKLQKATLINDENSYEFTFDEGDTNRFYISRTPLGKPAITTGVENTNVTPKAQKFIYQDKLYILRNGVLYDATGKVVK